MDKGIIVERIGIVGGYSHRSSSFFFSKLMERFYRAASPTPELVANAMSVDVHTEAKFVSGAIGHDAFQSFLSTSIKMLILADCKLLLLPCNSLHGLFSQVCDELDVHGLSPIHALQSVSFPDNDCSYGVLGTSQLMRSAFIDRYLPLKCNPSFDLIESHQEKIDNTVLSIISDGPQERHVDVVSSIVREYFPKRDRWIIACSEISTLTSNIRKKILKLNF